MASSYSNNLKLQLMATGENAGTWGAVTNVNLGTALEEALGGTVDVTFTGSSVTLSAADDNTTQQFRHMHLNLTGTSGGAQDLVVPAVEKVYIVTNGCADTITIKVASQTGVAIPTGKTVFVYNNGTDCVDAVTHLSSLTLASPLPVASGGTGSATATFSGANITALNASNVSAGTLANARTTASSSNGASSIVARDGSGDFAGSTITATTGFSGPGGSLTALNGSNISSGTVPTARLDASSANGANTVITRDASGNFAANTITANLTGTAANATVLETARTIGGVSFDGSASIDLPGVNTTGNQNTTGSAATLTTARTIAGQSFDGSANITIASTDLSDSGSINAATLDSIDSTSFLRSDAADTKTSGDLSFSDNVKAIFGAGSDLQIYHDGSNSIIADVGTGGLEIKGATTVVIRENGTDDKMFRGTGGGAAELFYDNAVKLATTSGGVAVTGAMYASGNIGLDTTDFISFTGNTRMDVTINGSNEFRFESDGDFHADGDVIAYSTTISDERLKTNIVGIENAVAKVSQLNGYTFEYKADGKISAGVIAQEVEQVLPEAVTEKLLPLKTDNGQEYKVVNYDALHGLLIEAVKELSARVEALEAK